MCRDKVCHPLPTPTFTLIVHSIFLLGSFPPTSNALPSSNYGQGLNQWSFQTHSQAHDLFSDWLCPNPMVGGNQSPIYSLSSLNLKYSFNSSRSSVGDGGSPIPVDIWAIKTGSDTTVLPCDLKQYASLNPLQGGGVKQYSTFIQNNSSLIQNRILFINLTLEPFSFSNAKLCNKFIKLQYDVEEGVELNCDDESPSSSQRNSIHHIYWPKNTQKRKKAFEIFKNLKTFLQNEETLRTKFFFQIYFTSHNDGGNVIGWPLFFSFLIILVTWMKNIGWAVRRVKKCTVQQYELDLREGRRCESKGSSHLISNICGEFSCDDLIFPYYSKEKVKFIGKNVESGRSNEGGSINYSADYEVSSGSASKPSQHQNNNNRTIRNFFFTTKKLDIRFIVFITCLPILLIGMLIFALEIIIYFTCLRRSRNAGEGGRDARSQQILQNSLNLWESIPNREARSVSFSPVTTNIDTLVEGCESPLPDPLSTPRVLKSALKKSTEHLPPPPASFFEMEREYPPTYVEAMNH